MFTSSEDAYFVLDAPYTFFTPAGAGNLVPVRGYAFSDVILSLVAQDGTYLVNSIVCDVLPTGVSIVSGGFGGYLFRVTAAFLAGHAGFFRASLRGTVAGDMIIQNTSFQWGGTIDLLATAATNINDNINGNVGRIQQAVMGNTTWDHTTGTVGMFDGESFVLADEAGTPVSDQSLAVRRINSTV